MFKWEKVYLQTSLERNLSNCSYSFSLLNVNFENITLGLYVYIIFFILAKF